MPVSALQTFRGLAILGSVIVFERTGDGPEKVLSIVCPCWVPQPLHILLFYCGSCCCGCYFKRGSGKFPLNWLLLKGTKALQHDRLSCLAHVTWFLVRSGCLPCTLWQISGPLTLQHQMGISTLGVNTRLLKSILSFPNDHSRDPTKLVIPLGPEPNSL